MNNYSEFLKFSIFVAKEAGKIQLKYFNNLSSLKSKSSNIDLLTSADIDSEEYIINNIKNKYPNHSIISEESDSILNKSRYKWVIDPLDGTTNFVHNIPIFAVSIGLQKDDITICSVVYNPAADKCFYATKGSGAFLNKKKINVTTCTTLANSLICTGFPYLHDSKYDRSFDIFKEFYDITRGVRRLGAAALDLCFVAMGRFDGFYEFGLNVWDICAGSLIVEEANGIVTDWDKNKLPDDGCRILASNVKIHNNMSEILTKKKYSIFF